MRRILLALLICLLPLQSFAGLAMSTKMAGMESSKSMAISASDATQVPCHEASQMDTATSHDCCGLQGVCHAICQLVASIPVQPLSFGNLAAGTAPSHQSIYFASAHALAPQKPPIA